MAAGGTMAARAERQGDLVADRRIYLNGDGQSVEGNDPNRATLLVGEGGILRREDAERLGMRQEEGRLVWGESAPAEEAAPAEPALAEGAVDVSATEPTPVVEPAPAFTSTRRR